MFEKSLQVKKLANELLH